MDNASVLRDYLNKIKKVSYRYFLRVFTMRKNKRFNSHQIIFGLGEDVLLGLFLAVFAFAVVLLLLVRSGSPPLCIHTNRLPDAATWNNYKAGIAVSGGSGPYEFDIPDVNLPTGLELIDISNGIIGGIARKEALLNSNQAKVWYLPVTVRDQKDITTEKIIPLKVCPAAVPFDPDDQPLEFVSENPNFQDVWTGLQCEATFSVHGGIEPYEIKCKSPLPPGLTLAKGRISGIPENSAVPQGDRYKDYSILVTVNDQQRTYSLGIDRKPQLSREFHLRVYRLESISLTSVLPAVRVGHRYRGAIVASGGKQKLIWQSDDLDNLQSYGFTLEPYSGLITAESVKTSDATKVVLLSFQVHVADPSGTVEPKSIKNAIKILPSMHFRMPD